MLTIALRLLVCVLIAFVIFGAILYMQQEKMIYKPRLYSAKDLEYVPPRAVKIEYEIPCGKQISWYVPAPNATDVKAVPETLWIFFGGNGSYGLSWSHIVQESPDRDAACLLFDYPGYGYCKGRPSPATMAESGDALVTALAGYLDVPLETLMSKKIRLMGHSLGSGVALAFAGRHPVDRIVLIAPFTSTRAMADYVATPVFGWMITHRLNNLEALDYLARQAKQPQVIITHGDADNVVPVTMGRELKNRHPDLVDYIEVKGANHGNILDGAQHYMRPELPKPLISLDME